MDKRKLSLALSLVIIGVVGRISFREFLPDAPHLYITLNGITLPILMMDMFFVVAIVSILSGILLGKRYAFAVPLATMLITDMYYGNNYILLFTWSGFVMIGLIGYLSGRRNPLSLKNIPTFFGAGIAGVLLYDLWTNFGCWLGWYPHTVEGLLLCYTLAIPFTLWHLLSTSIAIMATLVPVAYLCERHANINLRLVKELTKPQ
ncbi:MAG TPA: hypothetical protein ENG74_00840 [Thermoplasmatales archaeon]|nr:hypothetical protein [Thermoplasmatales archaeon]